MIVDSRRLETKVAEATLTFNRAELELLIKVLSGAFAFRRNPPAEQMAALIKEILK